MKDAKTAKKLERVLVMCFFTLLCTWGCAGLLGGWYG